MSMMAVLLKEAIENRVPRDGRDYARCKCFKCERDMTGGEPVWRIRVRRPGVTVMGWPRAKVSIEYFCEACTSARAYWQRLRLQDDELYVHSVVACSFCKRPMHDAVFRRCGFQIRRYHCCRRCEISDTNARVNEAARARRAEARGPSRQCDVCGEVFEPKRADARFCSGPCRQKAYRRRVTVAKRSAVLPI